MSRSAFRKRLEARSDHKGRRTYIMYHGTTLDNALKIQQEGFIPSSGGMLGPGVYVTRSLKKACAYPKHMARGQTRVILQLSVRPGRVKKINRRGHPLQKSWHEAGYNTAWVPPKCGMVKSGLEENCVWNPKRIRVLDILEEDSSSEESSDEYTSSEESSSSESESSDEDASEYSDDEKSRSNDDKAADVYTVGSDEDGLCCLL